MAEEFEDYIVIAKKDFNYKKGHYVTHAAHQIHKQEVIELMAKANWIATVCAKNQCVPVDITKEQWDEEWEKLRIEYKKVYYAGAEAALNALLGE